MKQYRYIYLLSIFSISVFLSHSCMRVDKEEIGEPESGSKEKGIEALGEDESGMDEEFGVPEMQAMRKKGGIFPERARRLKERKGRRPRFDSRSKQYRYSMRKKGMAALSHIPVSDLTLVATISEKEVKRGIVALPNGREFVVKIGDFIGSNGGRVVAIEKDKIVVSELEIDDMGNEKIVKKIIGANDKEGSSKGMPTDVSRDSTENEDERPPEETGLNDLIKDEWL